MLVVVMMGTFMASIDSTIVTVALPKMSVDLSAGFSLLGWVITGYLLGLVALILVAGKAGDFYGRKRVYVLGFAMFGLFSALCGVSQNIVELIGFRILQGAFASLIYAIGRPILLNTFSSREVSFAFGLNTAVSSIGAVVGPVIGGLLVALDWRLIFYVNVPIAIMATVIGTRNVPSNANERPVNATLASINPLSSGLLAVTTASVLVGLSLFDVRFVVVGFVLVLPLVLIERRSSNPLLNRELRTNMGFVYSMLAVSILTVGYSGIPVALSFLFQSVTKLSPQLTGILLAPLSMGVGVASPFAGRLYSRMRNPTTLTILGAAASGLACLVLGFAVGAELPASLLVVPLFVVGIAVGVYWIPMVTDTMKLARQDLIGTASGTFSMFVNLANAVSVAVTVGISAYFLPHALATQVYGGGLVNLSPSQAVFFSEGIEVAIVSLGLINLASLPMIMLVMKEQKKVATNNRGSQKSEIAPV